MIDKFCYWFFGSIDNLFNKIEKLFLPKAKRKKRNRCKICNCKCHCADVLHAHWYDKELCTCDTCRH